MRPFSGTRSYSQNSGSDFKTSLDYRARTCLKGKKQQQQTNNTKTKIPSKLANCKLSGFDALNSKSGFKQNINNM